MLILSKLHRQFPERAVEWGVSYMLISWGIILACTPGAFETVPDSAIAVKSVYTAWERIMPQHVWAFAALMIGMLRVSALYINGAHMRTPLARMVGAGLSMALWMLASLGVLQAGLVTTALGIYPWLMVGDAYAAYNAGGDWAKNKKAAVAVVTHA